MIDALRRLALSHHATAFAETIMPSPFAHRKRTFGTLLLLIGLVFAGLSVTTYFSGSTDWLRHLRLTKLFKATADIRISHQEARLFKYSGSVRQMDDDFETYRATQIAMIKSNPVLTAALRSAKVAQL